MSVFPGGVDQILAAVGQQVLLVAVDLHGRIELPSIDVHPILTFFRESHHQSHDVARILVRDVF